MHPVLCCDCCQRHREALWCLSVREAVRLSGRLQGMGRDVPCAVIAEKVTLPGTDVYEYARPMIADEPRDLPDGFYKVAFDGRTISVQRRDGAWIAPWSRI